MVQGHWFPMGSDLTEPLSIRERVFGRGEDALDGLSQQVVVYETEGAAVGAARLWWQDGAFWLGDVGVLEEKRGRGFGDLLVRLLLFKCLTHSADVICLRTPEETRPFFEKYGFASQDGGPILTLRGQDVHLSHCGGNCAGCDHQTEACIPKALR